MKPATLKARALLDKLQELAARGVNGERTAALAKVARLQARYDFTKPKFDTADLFAGKFRPSTSAAPVLTYTPDQSDIANAVKWAIEKATGIDCLYRAGQLQAQAAPNTAARLSRIASTISGSFGTLWTQFAAAPNVTGADRGHFILGLYEGMMDDARHDEPLPARHVPAVKVRARRRAVALPAGVRLHPYSVAVKLGRGIRFTVPLDQLTAELTDTLTAQLNPSTP